MSSRDPAKVNMNPALEHKSSLVAVAESFFPSIFVRIEAAVYSLDPRNPANCNNDPQLPNSLPSCLSEPLSLWKLSNLSPALAQSIHYQSVRYAERIVMKDNVRAYQQLK